MSSTRIKIVETSILLFNNKGLANVRLQDIAEYNDISPGNLTYHFKTKKDLMEYIIYYMIRKLVEIENTQRESLKHMSLYKILRNNIIFLFNSSEDSDGFFKGTICAQLKLKLIK